MILIFSNFKLLFVWTFIFYGLNLKVTAGDLYTALVNMVPLIHTEQQLQEKMDKYLTEESERLEKIKTLANVFKNSPLINVTDFRTILDNPINIFQFMQWIKNDGLPLIELMKTTKIKDFSEHIAQYSFPGNDDFSGVIAALQRLQEVYSISVHSLANGNLSSKYNATERLTAEDCYLIGRELSLSKEYHDAISWFLEGLQKNPSPSLKSDLLKYLVFDYDRVKDAIKSFEFLTELQKNELDTIYIDDIKDNFNLEEMIYGKSKKLLDGNKLSDVWIKYVNLCRNRISHTNPKIRKKLKCYYSAKNSTFLILQPIKTEDIHLKPWLVLYHEIVNDEEIALLKKIALPQLTRALVIQDNGTSTTADFRISKSATLDTFAHPIINHLQKRVEVITGLHQISYELLQIVNYGIGGHYEPHFDFDLIFNRKSKFWEIGNRIATVLFYLSDVIAGGATVFPELGVSVLPEKGSALFWYNLHKTGTTDLNTGHAACPVLLGSKWVSNQWIHEYHQEFRRPCGLNKFDKYEK